MTADQVRSQIRREMRREMNARVGHWRGLGRPEMATEAGHCLQVLEDMLDGQRSLFKSPPPPGKSGSQERAAGGMNYAGI